MDNTFKQLTCKYCKQDFSKKFNLNRHLKNIHNKIEEDIFQPSGKKCHIICVICSIEKIIGAYRTYKEYTKHLQEAHKINVEQNTYHFNNKDDFEEWHCRENRNVDYAMQSNSIDRTSTKVYYNCNRSDTRGYISNCSKRILKTGGSIKINGTCPSRIIATFLPEGQVMVRHNYTHVGHEIEVRTQQLSKADQKYLVEQLEAGVNTDRIIKNARQQQSGAPSRLNLVTKNDLTNLMRRKRLNRNSYQQVSVNDEEISDFLGEKSTAVNCIRGINMEEKRSLVMEQALNYLNQMSNLDNNSFAVFEKNFQVFMNKNNKDLRITGSKRKFENQTYYPQEKKKKK